MVPLRWWQRQQQWQGKDALLGLHRHIVVHRRKIPPSAGMGREQLEQGTESRRQVCELERSWQGVRSDQAQCLGVDSNGPEVTHLGLLG